MKKLKFKRNTILSVLIIVILFLFNGCDDSESKRIKTESRMTNDFEEIGYPVKLHYLERSGMKFMIASGYYGEAGVSVCNLTLDSLQVEFYKRSLNNK